MIRFSIDGRQMESRCYNFTYQAKQQNEKTPLQKKSTVMYRTHTHISEVGGRNINLYTTIDLGLFKADVVLTALL